MESSLQEGVLAMLLLSRAELGRSGDQSPHGSISCIFETQRSNYSPFIQSTFVLRYVSSRFGLMVLSNIEIIQFCKPAHQQSQEDTVYYKPDLKLTKRSLVSKLNESVPYIGSHPLADMPSNGPQRSVKPKE